MYLPTVNYLLWALGSGLKVVVWVFAIRRRVYLQLPLFTLYLTLLVFQDIFLWPVYLGTGYGSPFAFFYYWVTQAVLVVARAAVLAEIAWRALRDYHGIWSLSRRLLYSPAALLLTYAGVVAYGNVRWIAPFVLTTERGLEMLSAVLLLLLLVLSNYYEIRMGSLQKLVAVGLGVYSTIQIVNNSLMKYWPQYFSAWNGIRILSFQVALAIWLLALRRPLPAEPRTPALLPQQVYDQLSPQLNLRMRTLNARLMEMLKS